MPPHLQGGKFSGRHTTTIEAAKPALKAVAKLGCVTKIVLGVIQQVKGGTAPQSVKISDIPAGLRLKIRGPKTVQEAFVYTKDRVNVARVFQETFQANRR